MSFAIGEHSDFRIGTLTHPKDSSTTTLHIRKRHFNIFLCPDTITNTIPASLTVVRIKSPIKSRSSEDFHIRIRFPWLILTLSCVDDILLFTNKWIQSCIDIKDFVKIPSFVVEEYVFWIATNTIICIIRKSNLDLKIVASWMSTYML